MELTARKHVTVEMKPNVAMLMENVRVLLAGWGRDVERVVRLERMVRTVGKSVYVITMVPVILLVEHVSVRLDGREQLVKKVVQMGFMVLTVCIDASV